MRYRFPHVGADLRYLHQPDTSTHCKTTDTASVSRAVPAYFPTFRCILISPTHRGMVQAE